MKAVDATKMTEMARMATLAIACVYAVVAYLRFLAIYLMQTAYHILLSVGFSLVSLFYTSLYRSPKRVHDRRFAVF